MSSTVRTHRIDIAGMGLHVTEEGAGPPVLMGHGLFLDSSMWDELAPLLARDHRVIRLDFRGHGRSDAPRGPYTAQDQAKDWFRVMDALGIRKAALVGHGMGGFCALQAAHVSPERVDGMILLNTSGEAERWDDALRIQAFAAALRVGGLRGPLLQAVMDRLFSLSIPVVKKELYASWREKVAANAPASMALGLQMVAGRGTLDPVLQEVLTPTLVVAGSEDRLHAPEKGRNIVDRMLYAKYRLIDRSGHLAPVEKPEAVNEAVLKFFKIMEEGERDDRTGALKRFGAV